MASTSPHDPTRATFDRRRRRTVGAVATLAGAGLALAGCSVTGSGASTGSADADSSGGTVVLVTHDSFAVDPDLLADFEDFSGLTVTQVAPGDGGALVNQLILTKDSPLGDVVFGIDNSFASRAIDAGVLTPYTSPDLPAAAAEYAADDAGSLTPIDVGDVCVNVDHAWFAERGLAEPVTLEDLAEPEYRDLLVVENPATSSPGLSFLLATVGAFGADGWQAYWSALTANGVKVADGWEDAYSVDFSGSSGAGPRPLVVSYASSPPFEVPDGATAAPTGALLDTCFRQVEYAGVIAGAANPDGAQQLIDFLLGAEFQAGIPDQMYMYPVDPAAPLPEAWATYAPLADAPFTVPADEISAHRDDWIRAWTDTVLG
ncbi:thiamine ABC transporter substrate-binding protein [Pengzhenrongella sicca]|uniref:Thiamine ABC transporter substrate-binding protein n=1 Tax=Pengzhenrongella sicca TaxID=2819238 RepID=A0A8A4ZDC2_9MICO|nr:thiamine ABC transporter substrate-binding protein [Pengzhenrongella sicca]QTE29335.1 thiamine ABC transporter substrate-binding protein [Pengzhenrongella sicca]